MDLSEPAKIVGIKIMQMGSAISITQEKYIESILKRQGMESTNCVAMPMDPSLKLEPNPNGEEGS